MVLRNRDAAERHLSKTHPWSFAVALSLTELFAPDLIAERLKAFRRFYSWVKLSGLDYFERRLTQARQDSDEGLRLMLEHCRTRASQEEAVRAVAFKCDVLWAILDAILWRYAPDLAGYEAIHVIRKGQACYSSVGVKVDLLHRFL
jgi:pyrroloquinoline-quinone synthase